MKLTIGWIYPKLMNVYGDRGNITVLQKRSEWRDIEVEIKYLDAPLNELELAKCDLLMMGGAQDQQQEIVSKDLKGKSKFLRNAIESGIPGLYVCGAYQFLGNYYKEADGTQIEGLGIFDLYTQNPGTQRLIGNIVTQTEPSTIDHQPLTLVGFENHGGRTYLGKDIKPLGKVLKGYGNNGGDEFEGAIYKNSIGTYMHGPILPKNPKLADWLISKALEIKYKKNVELTPLDDSLEQKARVELFRKLGIKIDGELNGKSD
jgi:hypothetical protein